MSKQTSRGLCLRKNGNNIEILLVCEPSDRELKDSYRWALPGGKCCSDITTRADCCNETPEQTIIREAKEETGYNIAIVRMLSHDEKYEYSRYAFLIEITDGTKANNKVPGGKESLTWFSIKNLPRNMFTGHRRIVEQYMIQRLTQLRSTS